MALPMYPGGQVHSGFLSTTLHCALVPQAPCSRQGFLQTPSTLHFLLDSHSSSFLHSYLEHCMLASPWKPSGQRQTFLWAIAEQMAFFPQLFFCAQRSWHFPFLHDSEVGQSLLDLQPGKQAPSIQTCRCAQAVCAEHLFLHLFLTHVSPHAQSSVLSQTFVQYPTSSHWQSELQFVTAWLHETNGFPRKLSGQLHCATWFLTEHSAHFPQSLVVSQGPKIKLICYMDILLVEDIRCVDSKRTLRLRF